MLDSLRPVTEAGMVVLVISLFVVLTITCEIGFRFGRRRGRRLAQAGSGLGEQEKAATSTLVAGLLTLLAFTLGLTISFAQSRFEARRSQVAVEANTIGTAWLRAELVGGGDGGALAGLIHDYAVTRLKYTAAEPGDPIGALVRQTGVQQDQIWALTTKIARASPTPVTATLINAVNDMIDASLLQRFAVEGRVPPTMMDMLIAGSILAIAAMGYQLGLGGARQPVLSSLLLLMWTGGMEVTIDLNRPRAGSIRVDPGPLVWTIQGMKGGSGAPTAVTAPAPAPAR